ncbi:hypothetical protein [Cellulomonas terrae]|uniref:hypothetical protein n=1 Tax=Cellulomonas terrae TaxID=311234 RepID=UPI001649988C|nr:hypothetical protein [Cellulomonas terrae]
MSVPVVRRPVAVRSAVLAVCAVTGATGVVLLATASTLSAVSWLLVELPGAVNDLLPELGLALLGTVFLGLAVVGALVPRTGGAAGRKRLVTALLTGSVSLLVSVVGTKRVASREVADILGPVLDHPELLRVPESDGRLLLLVGLVLAVTSLVVVAAPTRRV